MKRPKQRKLKRKKLKIERETAAAAAAAEKIENEKKIENDKKIQNQFQDFFKNTNEEKMETEQDAQIVEKLKIPQINLTNTTKDYTDDLIKIHNANTNDPNIPHQDAIKAQQHSLKDIQTINMMIKTIKQMQYQISGLTTDTTILKLQNKTLNEEINQLKQQ